MKEGSTCRNKGGCKIYELLKMGRAGRVACGPGAGAEGG